MNTARMALILANAALIGVAVVSNSLTTSVTKVAASLRALHQEQQQQAEQLPDR